MSLRFRSRTCPRWLYRRVFPGQGDRNRDGELKPAEVKVVLSRINIGNCFTRSTWAKRIVQSGDSNGNDTIDASELRKLFKELVRSLRSKGK